VTVLWCNGSDYDLVQKSFRRFFLERSAAMITSTRGMSGKLPVKVG
jgi:hypothetical protein